MKMVSLLTSFILRMLGDTMGYFECGCLMFNLLVGVSYNLPKFCPNATWDSKANTFADSNVLTDKPVHIFVNDLNTVYVAVSGNSLVQAWLQGNATPTRTISSGFDKPLSLFVNILSDIYIDHGKNSKRVEKWSTNSSSGQVVMTVTDSCNGLFIDLNETLYCSMEASDKVVKRSLNSGGTSVAVAAGSGTGGSTANDLSGPQGIFVDFQFNLYVADTNNNRIQCFTYGSLAGTTVAGSTTPNTTITLSQPTGVVLDADRYLFIVDMNNSRINWTKLIWISMCDWMWRLWQLTQSTKESASSQLR